jgi:hypothetical protein
MAIEVLWETPAPSSGREGLLFRQLPKRTCTLTFRYENDAGQFGDVELRFLDVTAFKCTFLPSLTVEMGRTAYDKLVDMGRTEWLKEATAAAKSSGFASSLRHLRMLRVHLRRL